MVIRTVHVSIFEVDTNVGATRRHVRLHALIHTWRFVLCMYSNADTLDFISLRIVPMAPIANLRNQNGTGTVD